jgi:hypothetical protein
MMDLSFLADLSKLMGALVGAVLAGLIACVGGAIMLVVLKSSNFVRNTDVAQRIFSRVSPPVFYFGVTAPVWTVMGAIIGYQFAGNN